MSPSKFLGRARKIPEWLLWQAEDAGNALRCLVSRRHVFSAAQERLGFADHRSRQDVSRDPAIVRRLLAAYRRAKQAESSAPETYRQRGEWAHILEVEFANFLRCLRNGDEKGLALMLQNFCRNECSRGLSMSAEVVVRKWRPLYRYTYIRNFNEHYAAWRKASLRAHADAELAFPYVGNPVGMMAADGVLPFVNMRHLYYADKLLRLIPGERAAVAEIGGGFGGLGYLLLKDKSRQVRYANFDLPEMNVVNGYFLLNAMPDRKIVLYGESDSTVSTLLGGSDAVIYPQFMFRELADDSIDAVFNSCSFSEMDADMVDDYMRHIDRVCRGSFMHVNHDIDRYYDAARTKKHVLMSERAPSKDRFKAVYVKKQAYFHPKYLEYLYQRFPQIS